MYSYNAYGLTVCSTLALPELRRADVCDDDADLVIAPLTEVPSLPRPDGVGLLVGYAGDDVILQWPYFGTYRVRAGQRIEFAPAPGLGEAAARVPLLGVCLGVLLHQRGLLTLHASAVTIGSGAVAFVGEKGAGKSTTTAALVARGHTLMADDVVAVRMEGESTEPVVLPGLAAMKLWPDSLAAVGIDPESVPTLHDDVEKRIWRVSEDVEPQPRPLRCIYVLDVGERISSSPVPMRDAFAELVRHTYAARFLGDAAVGVEHFKQCTSLLATVPVRRLTRPDDAARLADVAAHVESEWG